MRAVRISMLRSIAQKPWRIGVALLLIFALLPPSPSSIQVQAAPVFTVNSAGDIPDAIPGDGVCEITPGSGICTLRAAVEEANADNGGVISLPSGVYGLTLGVLNFNSSIRLEGTSSSSSIIDGNHMSKIIFVAYGSSVVLTGITIRNGYPNNEQSPDIFGVGIENQGTLLLERSIVMNNSAGTNSYGGGISNIAPAVMTVTASLIYSNAAQYGGGVHNSGTMTIISSTIEANSAAQSGFGGGITNWGQMNLDSSTVDQNIAGSGGGITAIGASTLTMTNSTISSNVVNGSGGGLLLSYFCCIGNAGVRAYYSTIANNYADNDLDGVGRGAGVSVDGGTSFRFYGTIIAGNYDSLWTGASHVLAPGDCNGSLVSLGFTIVKDPPRNYCTIGGTYSQANPQLGPLRDNGGPTYTHMPGAGSPAADAVLVCTDALSQPVTHDQRGMVRPIPHAGNCDMGSVERLLAIYMPFSIQAGSSGW